MERVHIKDLKNYIGKVVTVGGFVHTLRDQNKIVFILVRDITGIIQCVVLKDVSEVLERSKNLSNESVVLIHGLVKEEKQAHGGIEIEVKDFELLSLADPVLPIPVIAEKGGGEANQQARLDTRWIDLRMPEKAQIFKVWTTLERGFRSYFEINDFMQVYAPSFMSTPSESGAEVFEINYFESKAYLAQSPQFYKQMAIASGFERVFCFGPVFRAEHSFTTRHLTEFTGWDFEVAFMESHHDIMDHEEGMIIAGFTELLKIHPELNITVPTQPFPRLSMKEVKAKLAEHEIISNEDNDISPEEERAISEIIKNETGHEFVFITDYHMAKRPFYHMRHENNPQLTKSADLIFRGIEITTLAQREHRIDKLIEQAKEKGIDIASLEDYLNFFRYGCPPHGGAGIGPARIIMKILDLPNIREATYLPRDVKRLRP